MHQQDAGFDLSHLMLAGNKQYQDEWRKGAKTLHANFMNGGAAKKDFLQVNGAWCDVSAQMRE